MYYFEDVIDEIEKNLLNDIDIDALAKKMKMSVYEFRRIFTFVTKMPLGEYIRKRRLSLAALDLQQKKASVSEISKKYGYDSQSAFSRAFKEFHQISPSDSALDEAEFKLLTKINAKIVVSGCSSISYKIQKDSAFYVSGFSGNSALGDTECCEDVWSGFYAWEGAEELSAENDKIYAVYKSEKNFVSCHIGVRGGNYPDKTEIGKSEWACFAIKGADDEKVNEFYSNILGQWLSSSGYERDISLPNIEIFPSDMSKDDFEWEIRIPVVRSK